MGRKKYYCDLCDRSFNDDLPTRAKHFSSVIHQKLKKEHYNMFRDPETILAEESVKRPCNKFHSEGYCPFGSSCYFSHYSHQDMRALEESVTRKKRMAVEIPTLESWLKKQDFKVASRAVDNNTYSHVISNELGSVDMLPFSVRPFEMSEFLKADLASWGM